MSPKVAVGNGSSVVLVLGLDPFPRTASPSQGEGESSGYHAERRLMNECVREAFWSRVLPLSGCLALAFRQAARMRLIASHPTIGVPLRYWALGALVGFEGGCAMYGDSCANKAVVRMPNSKLVANILRIRNQLPANNFDMSGGGEHLLGISSGSASETHSEEKPSSQQWDWQIFPNPPEETVAEDCDIEQGPSSFTYAELRKRNRGTMREKLVTSRPVSVYEKLRLQNREEASLTEEQMCQRRRES